MAAAASGRNFSKWDTMESILGSRNYNLIIYLVHGIRKPGATEVPENNILIKSDTGLATGCGIRYGGSTDALLFDAFMQKKIQTTINTLMTRKSRKGDLLSLFSYNVKGTTTHKQYSLVQSEIGDTFGIFVFNPKTGYFNHHEDFEKWLVKNGDVEENKIVEKANIFLDNGWPTIHVFNACDYIEWADFDFFDPELSKTNIGTRTRGAIRREKEHVIRASSKKGELTEVQRLKIGELRTIFYSVVDEIFNNRIKSLETTHLSYVFNKEFAIMQKIPAMKKVEVLFHTVFNDKNYLLDLITLDRKKAIQEMKAQLDGYGFVNVDDINLIIDSIDGNLAGWTPENSSTVAVSSSSAVGGEGGAIGGGSVAGSLSSSVPFGGKGIAIPGYSASWMPVNKPGGKFRSTKRARYRKNCTQRRNWKK
jgi:hypothetical protein